ncbi:MAG TPA: hypothetical protein VN688_02855 [Gemmataceae bacterium]|nr:hypothetical protein [Gemmataceae bacterium]
MLEYQITKYNPSFRDSSGAYTRDEWTSISDIGRSFGGVVLTATEYRRVEDAYVAVALSFLRESGQSALTVSGLENNRKYPIEFGEGSVLALEQLGTVIRLVLREKFWCRLEGLASFLHFGWDYYMYAGVPCSCPASQELAKKLRVFVEESPSPYKREAGAQGSGNVSVKAE